jgi:tetrahydromethanopterin S-methyltransferase subunit A
MPRNPDNKRVEILLSPEQYQAIERYVKIVSKGDENAVNAKGDIANAIRDILLKEVPGFRDAKPLVERGKYDRKEKVRCPKCKSTNLVDHGIERGWFERKSDHELYEAKAHQYQCLNCFNFFYQHEQGDDIYLGEDYLDNPI